ncbi:HD domain-containing phosphohydrolase [Thermotoga neapolitana]|uniref:Metal dependent phosphohydrolase n=1 Tax=Thermotoga neapolitana (strain ATCC 49049 / DSM 4359 / NBRC 107923 / NS-E) TaxID=309803 RepID=B9KB30_THENN|nr:Metal dependent phosphohydrolase [Thermotoga neapolitana DSM 4359]AJG40193.1 phosphohydrolase [Thermotoga sp. RQ7]
MLNLTVQVPLESFVKIFNHFGILEYRNFVKHSIQVAKITREMVEKLSLPVDLDLAYLSGLVHDTGLVLLASTENYKRFSDLFRGVADLEKLVFSLDEKNRHAGVSHTLISSVDFLSSECKEAVLYHHAPYHELKDETTTLLANCINAADRISQIHLKHHTEELSVDFLKEATERIENDPGITSPVKQVALEILHDHCIVYLLDENPRFHSPRLLSLSEFEPLVKILAFLLDVRSIYTRQHTLTVAEVSRIIAEEMLGEEDAKLVYIAALLHDVGKISVPLEILHKPGKLNEVEMFIMRNHVVDTYRILEEAGLGYITKIAAAHHERCDGSGYPLGLTSRNLTVHQKILQVTDVFSALIEDRPYRKALSVSEALKILEKEASQGKLDRRVIETLKLLVERKDTVSRLKEQAFARFSKMHL